MEYLEYVIKQDEVMVTNKKEIYKDIVTLLGECRMEFPTLLIDFANVNYIDSSGMGMMLEIHKTLRGRLYFYNFNEKVFDLFGLTNLLSLFKIFATKEDILNELEKQK